MHKAVIRLTSVTYAIRAQKLLEKRGIRSIIKKITTSLNVNGCGYGLELASADLNAAQSVIASAGIKIVEISA